MYVEHLNKNGGGVLCKRCAVLKVPPSLRTGAGPGRLPLTLFNAAPEAPATPRAREGSQRHTGRQGERTVPCHCRRHDRLCSENPKEPTESSLDRQVSSARPRRTRQIQAKRGPCSREPATSMQTLKLKAGSFAVAQINAMLLWNSTETVRNRDAAAERHRSRRGGRHARHVPGPEGWTREGRWSPSHPPALRDSSQNPRESPREPVQRETRLLDHLYRKTEPEELKHF